MRARLLKSSVQSFQQLALGGHFLIEPRLVSRPHEFVPFALVLSHPFRKKREMDGARKVLLQAVTDLVQEPGDYGFAGAICVDIKSGLM
jgi:hypothetical protein